MTKALWCEFPNFCPQVHLVDLYMVKVHLSKLSSGVYQPCPTQYQHLGVMMIEGGGGGVSLPPPSLSWYLYISNIYIEDV